MQSHDDIAACATRQRRQSQNHRRVIFCGRSICMKRRLDDSPHCAEVHYKLADVYDDKMKDPLNALHHFKRYLVVSPDGPHANEVKHLMKHDEVMLLTTCRAIRSSRVPRPRACETRIWRCARNWKNVQLASRGVPENQAPSDSARRL